MDLTVCKEKELIYMFKNKELYLISIKSIHEKTQTNKWAKTRVTSAKTWEEEKLKKTEIEGEA